MGNTLMCCQSEVLRAAVERKKMFSLVDIKKKAVFPYITKIGNSWCAYVSTN
jgi:hypothetical protein